MVLWFCGSDPQLLAIGMRWGARGRLHALIICDILLIVRPAHITP